MKTGEMDVKGATDDQELVIAPGTVNVGGVPRPAGLSSAEVVRLREQHGPNVISSEKVISPLKIFARQFTGLLVVILIVAAAIAAALGEMIDAVAIGLVVIVNGILGFIQEWKAETALEALRQMLAPEADVIRDGRPQRVLAADLVPGDVVILSAGRKVPADMRLTDSVALRVDESILTGESVPVDRVAGTEEDKVFMGTLIVAGRAEGIVTATGAETSFGRIADLTGSVGEKTTRLQRELGVLARQLGAVGLAVAALIILMGLLTGHGVVDMLLTGLSMAVAVVPEGLPAVVTVTLALGAGAMVRQKALVRRLQAVETLGAASVICTDKTGTLTENMMTAVVLSLPDRRYEVTGTGYDPAGRIERDGTPVRAVHDPDLAEVLETAQICNHAVLDRTGEHWTMTGDPTEGALVTLAYKGWAPIPDEAHRLSETPFSSERKRMSVLARDDAGNHVLHAKGAPEAILDICIAYEIDGEVVVLDDPAREELRTLYEDMASDGLRVIALARRPADDPGDRAEERLTFLGFAGLLDPPRPEVARAVQLCHTAGIRAIMITGDSPVTARAIAGQLGIGQEQAITGAELETMDDPTLSRLLEGEVLFARTRPAHKMRIVRLLQDKGAIVAMTGDGVNDAPALRQADIGVAMGQRGTDVAKDAADVVILDDNFATIVRAIREGRRQFGNIRKFVRYLLSANLGEVLALTANLLIGGPLIFFPIHILWMNLVTDGVSALTLGLEKAEPDQMERPPLARHERILTTEGLFGLALLGGWMAVSSLFVFYHLLPEGDAVARTAAFSTIVMCEEVAVFAFRSNTRSALRLGLFSNRWLVLTVAGMIGLQGLAIYWPPLQTLLRTAPLTLEQVGLVVAMAVPLVFVPTILKALKARSSGSEA